MDLVKYFFLYLVHYIKSFSHEGEGRFSLEGKGGEGSR